MKVLLIYANLKWYLNFIRFYYLIGKVLRVNFWQSNLYSFYNDDYRRIRFDNTNKLSEGITRNSFCRFCRKFGNTASCDDYTDNRCWLHNGIFGIYRQCRRIRPVYRETPPQTSADGRSRRVGKRDVIIMYGLSCARHRKRHDKIVVIARSYRPCRRSVRSIGSSRATMILLRQRRRTNMTWRTSGGPSQCPNKWNDFRVPHGSINYDRIYNGNVNFRVWQLDARTLRPHDRVTRIYTYISYIHFTAGIITHCIIQVYRCPSSPYNIIIIIRICFFYFPIYLYAIGPLVGAASRPQYRTYEESRRTGVLNNSTGTQ